jgi:hypothetical protein
VENEDDGNNNINDMHTKYQSLEERTAVAKVIQRHSHLQIIHTKEAINGLGYISTNSVKQKDICTT